MVVGVKKKLPKGYFGIGLNIEKYGKDKTWIGKSKQKGEWPIAYHGVGARSIYILEEK